MNNPVDRKSKGQAVRGSGVEITFHLDMLDDEQLWSLHIDGRERFAVTTERVMQLVARRITKAMDELAAMPTPSLDDPYQEPEFDDGPKRCPECEAPSQFGGVCAKCLGQVEL